MINQKTRLFISFIFILLCINTYTGTYNIYHEQLDTNTDYKIVSTGFYYNDNSFLNKNNFSEPYNLMIKTNLFYMNPEILYPEYIIFTDYEKSNNYPIMELWENTEYLYKNNDRYVLVIDTRLFDIKKDVTNHF